MARYDVHVVPQGDEWAVIREGDALPVSLHPSREGAKRAAFQLATDGDVELVIHPGEGSDGAYDDDPRLTGS